MSELKLQKRESTFFTTYSLLKAGVRPTDISEVKGLIGEIMLQNNLKEEMVHEIKTHYSAQNDELVIDIVYCTFMSPKKIAALPREELIHAVLNQMGYTDENILSIKYAPISEFSSERTWIATIHDKKYNSIKDGDPTLYGAKDYYNNVASTAKEVLGFHLCFDFV